MAGLLGINKSPPSLLLVQAAEYERERKLSEKPRYAAAASKPVLQRYIFAKVE